MGFPAFEKVQVAHENEAQYDLSDALVYSPRPIETAFIPAFTNSSATLSTGQSSTDSTTTTTSSGRKRLYANGTNCKYLIEQIFRRLKALFLKYKKDMRMMDAIISKYGEKTFAFLLTQFKEAKSIYPNKSKLT